MIAIDLNLKMPKNCYDCDFRKCFGCYIANANGWINNKVDENCFLREVKDGETK